MSSSSSLRIPMFSNEKFDDWKIRMQVHLCAVDDEMWTVIEDGPIKITKPRAEWTATDRRRANLDNIAKDIFFKTLDDAMFGKVKRCKTAKEIWEKLSSICEGTELIKENRLSLAVQKFENFKMKPGESLDEMDIRFNELINELTALDKEYTNREMALKVLRALPKEWEMKSVAMRESKDLSKISTQDLFSDLKAYQFEMIHRRSEEVSTSYSQKSMALAAVAESSHKSASTSASNSAPRPDKPDVNERVELLAKKFKNFLKKERRS